MSREIAKSHTANTVSRRATELAVDVAWRQWAIINPLAKRSIDAPRYLVDPESLVLSSLSLLDAEPRLLDLVGWCAQRASTLLSVQRMRTLQPLFASSGKEIGWFAHWSMHLGNDRRWSRIAQHPDRAPRPAKGPSVLHLTEPATLLLRLRAGFGVGVKPDLTAFLICQRENPRSATEIAEAIGYTDKTVRLAVRELLTAGFVDQTTGEYPVRYTIRYGFSESFMKFLYPDFAKYVPSWGYWAQVFSFLLKVASWNTGGVGSDDYVASSEARDLFGEFDKTFRELRLRMPRPEPHPGETYLMVFGEFMEQLALWLEQETPNE